MLVFKWWDESVLPFLRAVVMHPLGPGHPQMGTGLRFSSLIGRTTFSAAPTTFYKMAFFGKEGPRYSSAEPSIDVVVSGTINASAVDVWVSLWHINGALFQNIPPLSNNAWKIFMYNDCHQRSCLGTCLVSSGLAPSNDCPLVVSEETLKITQNKF